MLKDNFRHFLFYPFPLSHPYTLCLMPCCHTLPYPPSPSLCDVISVWSLRGCSFCDHVKLKFFKTMICVSIQSGQLSFLHVRLDLEGPGIQILLSPIEFLIGERLWERFYTVCHKIRLHRLEFKIMIWYIFHILPA